MNENILITGATGYIGSNIVRHCLDLGASVSVLVRKGSSLTYLEDIKTKINVLVFDGDIKKLEGFIEKNNIEIVMHLASLYITEHVSSDVENLIDSNIKLGTILLEAMKNCNIKYFINTSTTWQHYKNEVYNPVNLYAATKEAFEDIIKYYIEKEYIKAITLEIFDSYGPGDNRNKLINNLYKYTQEGKELLMSEGYQKLDLVFIDDIVFGYIRAMEMLINEDIKYRRYGLFSSSSKSLREIINLYEVVKGVKLNIKWGERPYRDREVMKPAYKVEKLPGWSAQMNIEVGIDYVK